MELWLLIAIVSIVASAQQSSTPAQSCYEWTGNECLWEPNLKPMQVNFGQYNETFYAYVTPDVSTFYNKSVDTLKEVKVGFTGMYGKFINLSPNKVRVEWTEDSGKTRSYISDIEPFGSTGLATYHTHVFLLTPIDNPNKILVKWTISAETSLYYYDPFDSSVQKASKALNKEQLTYYHMQLQNRVFATQYKAFTGTDWLALYKQKLPPRYHMYQANNFGETYTVETDQIYFVELPPEDELKRGNSMYGPRPDDRTRMRRYRDKFPKMNLTLTVLSCAPRVFEIQNFLSDVEVNHILDLASRTKLHKSQVQSNGLSDASADDRTRTSTNNWIPRHTDLIIDAIYHRAADVLKINESLLRWRHKFEIPEFPESKISIAEHLQLVHYDVGQKYTPHHDFVMPSLVNMQPSRFATILFYLNGDMDGGETAFPRWMNAETSEPLKVKPAKGKAVLFYNLLPDGNFDERSQHEALPVIRGEKYLTNLWVWDPLMDHTITGHV